MVISLQADMEARFDELQRWVRFDRSDVEHLRALHVLAAPHFERISLQFYERIREHEEAHAVFTSEAQIERLQRSLVDWLHRLCSADRDARYVAETAKIGQVHVRVGLPQRYVFSAMALIRIELEHIADSTMGDHAGPVRAALLKAIDLELAVMLEAYHEDFVARTRRIEQLEREQLGRALARSEHRYVNAVELAPYVVIGLGAGGTILLFNRAAERLTGFERDQVLGRSFAETLLTEGTTTDMIDAVVRDESPPAVVETAFRTQSGSLRNVRLHFAHAPSEQVGDVVAFAIGRDVTNETALAERTRRSEKLAAVGTLAAGLAHEIRNPLNGAQLHVTFLERRLTKTKDHESLEAVAVVREEIKRLSMLVDEFLDFARPRPLELKPTDLGQLANHAIQMMGARPDAVTLTAQLPASELVVDIDAAKIEQVLLNLLQNAVEALQSRGKGSVVLRVRRHPLHAVMEVEDDGPGLPPGNAPVFDAFYSTKPNGTGLGLAIAHRIVTDHGGTIEVESVPGRTRFTFTLPIQRGGPPSAPDRPW